MIICWMIRCQLPRGRWRAVVPGIGTVESALSTEYLSGAFRYYSGKSINIISTLFSIPKQLQRGTRCKAMPAQNAPRKDGSTALLEWQSGICNVAGDE